MTQRSVGLCIVLTIVTCGIYGIYWIYCLADDCNKVSGDPNPTSPGMVILLSIVTCGIYGWFWLYKAAGQINQGKANRGMPVDSNAGIIYIVLAIFGLSIVSYALMQNELNKLA